MTDRLNRIFEKLEKCGVFADIGCDHGYIAKAMLDSGKCEKAIISDISAKCLSKAQELLEVYLCSGKAESVVSDGFDKIGFCDQALIAGMGGETIMEILAAAPWTKNGEHLLLLQPQTKIEELRVWLSEQGYCCVEEKLVLDKEKLYVVLLVRGGKSGKCGVLESYAGFCLSQDSLYGTYLDRQIKRLQLRAAGLERGGREDETLAALIDALKKKREEWTNANS
jgi:tRNA (adenine22-N1)-methyltransferase